MGRERSFRTPVASDEAEKRNFEQKEAKGTELGFLDGPRSSEKLARHRQNSPYVTGGSSNGLNQFPFS
jgi:hypothetical protein